MEIRKKNYLTLSVTAILFLAVVFLAIPFLIGKIQDAASKLALQKEEFGKMQEEQRGVLKWKKEYQSAKQEMDKITSGFISREGALDFIVSLEKIAQETGNRYEIKVVEKTSATTQNKETPSEFIDFQVSLWGNFPNLIRFMARLDNLPYINEIQSLQIQRLTADDPIKGVRIGDIFSALNIRAYLSPIK